MTTKRGKKDEKAGKRPKLKKETLKDLEAPDKGEGVRGGAAGRLCSRVQSGCMS